MADKKKNANWTRATTRSDPTLSARVSPELKAAIVARCKPDQWGWRTEPVGDVVRRALIEYAERHKPTPKKERARF